MRSAPNWRRGEGVGRAAGGLRPRGGRPLCERCGGRKSEKAVQKGGTLDSRGEPTSAVSSGDTGSGRRYEDNDVRRLQARAVEYALNFSVGPRGCFTAGGRLSSEQSACCLAGCPWTRGWWQLESREAGLPFLAQSGDKGEWPLTGRWTSRGHQVSGGRTGALGGRQ
ncbi:hypothetical protein NDU88_001599 [Pleurodeles waltl]|uniref:Uncharacterized protein n=1 Tax=Pleurodeles waltl TaxID=8319 RepID=A0AAV7SZW6_PLEWA|nr:hypothetical protein NDU88_001599 [Pleurodeles waltl]